MGNIELVLDALRRHVLKFAHVLSIVLLSTAIYGCNAKIIGEGGGGALGGGGGGSAGGSSGGGSTPVGPTVTNVTSSTANGTYSATDSVSISITFSEIVNVVGTPTLVLETGATDRTVNYSSGTGTTTLVFTYTVQPGDTSADLDYVGTGSLAAGTSIRNAAGTDATLTLPSPGAANSLSANKAIVIDNTGPTVTSVSSSTANGTYTTGGTVNITVTFSEAVTVTGTPTIALETGATDRTVNYSSGTGTTTLVFAYTVQAGDASGDLDYLSTTALSAGTSIRSAIGNDATLTLPTPGAANSLGANKAIVIDTGAPSVTSVSATTANGSYNAGDTVDVTVTFSEVVTVTGTPTIVLETGATDRTVNYSSGTGSATLTFTYTVQAGDTSSDLDYVGTGSLAAGTTIRDGVGNDATLTLPSPGAANSLGANKAIVIDTTAPTVSSVSSTTNNGTYAAGSTVDVTVTFSESVTVAGTPTIVLETGATDRTVNYSSGSGGTTLTFTYTVQAGDTSSDLDYVATTSLAAGTSIRDAAGNDATLTLASPGAANSLGANKAIVIDNTGPTVSSVNSPTAAGTYKAGDTIDVVVNFNETVTVVGTPTIVLETGATDRTVNYSSGSGSTALTFTYTVQAGDTSSDLDYVATTSLAAGTSIRDSVGNDATLTLASPGAANSLGANEALVIDTTGPTVSSVNSPTAAGSYNAGDTIDVVVNFNENVTVVGTPTIVLETGATDRTVNYSSGSGGTALTFTYTVQAGDTSSDLDYVATTSLAAGTSIRDAAGNDATLTLASPGAANSLGANEALVIDTTAPTVSSVNSPTAAGSYNAGDTIDVVVNFNENVTVVGTPTIVLETGTTDRTVNYSSGSGGTALTFTYTVQAGDTSSDLDYVATTSLAAGTSIRDAAGNDATLTLASPGAANSLGANEALVIDTTAPTVTGVASNSAAATYGLTDVIDVRVTFSENVTVVGTPTIILETGATDRTVNYVSGTGTTELLFNYTVQAGDSSADLDYVGTTSLTAGTSIRDAAGNDADRTLASPGAAGSLGANEAIVIVTPTAVPSDFPGFQIAYGDFDRDGDIDVVIPSLSANEVIPYLNNGSGTLSAGTAVTVGTKPVAVLAADINRDGKLDLVVSNWDADTVGTLIGVGDGTFGAMTSVAVGDKPAGLAALDINKDGDLDIVVANYGADNVQLLSNSGLGILTAGATNATGTGPTSVVAGDWDRDGDQDIAVTNFGSGTVTVLATALGLLGADESITVGTNPFGIVVGDFNADGKPDLAVANYGDNDVSVSLNGGTSFGAKTDTAVGTGPIGIAAVRWNAGGALDLVISNSGSDNYSVLSGVGDGTFGAAANTALGSTDPSGVAIGDFNRNGEPDVVFMYSTGATATALASGSGTTGDGTFTVTQTLSFAAGSNGPEAVQLVDIDRDGDLDIVTGEGNLDAVYVSLNDGTGTFGALSGTSFPTGGAQGVNDILVGDFDNDGDSDLVVSHGNGVAAYTYFSNDGSGTLTASTRANVGVYILQMSQVPVDIDRDGDLDFVGDDSNNGETKVYINNGSGTFTNSSAGASYAYYGLRDFILADVSRDGKADLFFLEIANDFIAGGVGNGAGAFGAAADYQTSAGSNNPFGFDLQDYDRDGDLDYAAANNATTTFGVGKNDGSGAFAAVTEYNAGGSAMSEPGKVASGDFDSDGDLDVAISSFGNDYIYIFTNDASAAFTYSNRTATGDGPWGLAVGDVNKDGKLDWVTTNANTGNPSTLSIGTGN